ncbi:MAG: hypothetical protein LBV55_02090 [Acholeplasmatales bacterium]|nr:hypothetical protein [Acholeplasmatales bacterium]
MDPQKVINKRRNILIAFLSLLVIFLVAIILVSVLVKNDVIMSSINLGLLLIFLIISLVFRKPLFVSNTSARVANLILKQGPPLVYQVNIVDNPQVFSAMGFTKQVHTSDFVMYYRHSLLRTTAFKKVYKLEVSYILKKTDYDFYHQDIEVEINKIENSFSKGERPTKYIIIGYKNYESFDSVAKKELAEVVSYTLNRQNFSQINVGFVKKEARAYFLYSEKYAPSMYYQEAVEFIKNVISDRKEIYLNDPLKKIKKNKRAR